MDPIGIYKRARRRFVLIVYFLMILMIILSLVQWLLVLLLSPANDFFKEKSGISLCAFMLAVMLITVFIFIESLRFFNILNAVITFIIMELDVIGVMGTIVNLKLWHFVYSFIVVFLFCLMIMLIGSLCAIDLTLAVVQLFVITFIFFVASVYFIMLYILANNRTGFYIFMGFVSFIVLFFMMYHAQTIQGSHYAEMRVKDYYLAALILYSDFIILLLIGSYMEMILAVAIEQAIKKASEKLSPTKAG